MREGLIRMPVENDEKNIDLGDSNIRLNKTISC